MTVQFITEIIQDGAFAAIAAIGFAIISNPPRKAILISALLAAIGHGLRYFLMHTAMLWRLQRLRSSPPSLSACWLSRLQKPFIARQKFFHSRLYSL